jgi:hypothetical protein
MSPEVLIYIQDIKNYFNKNIKVKKYFLENMDEVTFFDLLTDMSQKKYEIEGDPVLNKEEFETIRNPTRLFILHDENVFIDFGEYVKICKN